MNSDPNADAATPDGDGNDATEVVTQALAEAAPSSGASPTELAQPQHQHRPRPDAKRPYVTVSDPIQHNEGIKGKFTMYRVAYDPPPPAAGGGNPPDALFPYATAVNRRYSDFAWCFDHLHKERPGAIVPPLPDKQWQQLSRLSEEFVEERRLHLEVFLRRVVCSPELKGTECLLVFLGGADDEFKKAKKDGSFGKVGVPGSPSGRRSVNQVREEDYVNDGIDQQDTLAGSKNGIKKWIKVRILHFLAVLYLDCADVDPVLRAISFVVLSLLGEENYDEGHPGTFS